MDLEVKREVVEEQPNTMWTPNREQGSEPKRYEEETLPDTTSTPNHEQSLEPKRNEEETIAQLSLSPASKPKRKRKPKIFYTEDEQFSFRPMKKKEKIILKIKKRQSETTMKHAAVPDSVGSCKSCKKNKAAVDGKCPHVEPKSPAMIRAEEVQSNLEHSFPSFPKSLLRSHVASCFWMGLPGPFCKLHLPSQDTTVTLEDECGKQWEAKYFAEKTGLSAGWRQFSTGHNLLEGDVLVFQLVGPLKFKVYIIRANDFTEVDGALGLLNLDSQTKQIDAEMGLVAKQHAKRKRKKSLPLAVVQKKNKKSVQPISASNLGQPAEQSEDDSEEVGSEVLEGFKLSSPAVGFKDVTSLDDFNILVDGLAIDSELPDDIRSQYYMLCSSQNTFLHDNLIQGINSKLIVGTISETVNIADAMRTCKFSTPRDEFAMWDRTLKAFELLGMNVGFLRARLRRLVSLAFESEGAVDTRRYIEAKDTQALMRDEIRNMEARLAELKGACERYGAEIENLKCTSESYELKFQEEVNAPW